MKLVREIPRFANLIAISCDLFGNTVVFYKYFNQKFCKIYNGKNDYKCYTGHDCF